MNTKINEIAKRLNGQGKMSFLPAATGEQISLFEKENSIKLPQCYKEWLLFSDGGEFFLPAGVQLHGVVHKPLLNANNDDRPNDSFIVMGVLSFGDPVLFKKGSEEICIYNHSSGKIENDEIYPDFFAFLNDLQNIVG